MHSDLAKEIEANPAATLVEEQAALDEWLLDVNYFSPSATTISPHPGIVVVGVFVPTLSPPLVAGSVSPDLAT